MTPASGQRRARPRPAPTIHASRLSGPPAGSDTPHRQRDHHGTGSRTRTMIRIEGLTKAYGKFVAVDNIDLHVPRGELFGFLGPNGAGKTTTMRIVAGIMRPTNGRIR